MLMGDKETKELTAFFKAMNRAFRKHGMKKIIITIQSIDLQDNNVFFRDILNFIFETVCDKYEITIDELRGKETRGESTTARKLAIILAKEHLDISDELLAAEFGRVRQVVFGIMKEYEAYDREDKYHKDFFKVFDEIDEKVLNHIDKLKN